MKKINHEETIKRLKWLLDDFQDESIARGEPLYNCAMMFKILDIIKRVEKKRFDK